MKFIVFTFFILCFALNLFGDNYPGLNNYKLGLTSISQDNTFIISNPSSNTVIPKGTYYGIYGSADFFFDTRVTSKIDFGFLMGTWFGLSNSFDNTQSDKDMWGISLGLNLGFVTVYQLSDANNKLALKTYLQADWDRIPVIGIKLQPQYQMDNLLFEAGILIPMLYASEREESLFDASFMYLFKNIGIGLKYDLRTGKSADNIIATVNQFNLVIQFHQNIINL